MRAENLPPSRRSTVLRVVCQSSEALFHCLMSSGLFHACQTESRLAFTTLSTVIFMRVSCFLRSFREEVSYGLGCKPTRPSARASLDRRQDELGHVPAVGQNPASSSEALRPEGSPVFSWRIPSPGIVSQSVP